jgi:DNA-binding NtrC family response regulator
MGKRILIVDDEEILCDLLGDSLKIDGHAITKAYDGQTALDLLQKNDYDLGIIDLFLPVKTGIEIMQFIKDNKIKIDIIMASGYTEAATAEEAIKLGARDFIIKPFNLKALKSVIQRIFDTDIRTKNYLDPERKFNNDDINIQVIEKTITSKTEKIKNDLQDSQRDESPDFVSESIGKDTILNELRATNWNRSKTADNLGISLLLLYSKIKEYDIKTD